MSETRKGMANLKHLGFGVKKARSKARLGYFLVAWSWETDLTSLTPVSSVTLGINGACSINAAVWNVRGYIQLARVWSPCLDNYCHAATLSIHWDECPLWQTPGAGGGSRVRGGEPEKEDGEASNRMSRGWSGGYAGQREGHIHKHLIFIFVCCQMRLRQSSEVNTEIKQSLPSVTDDWRLYFCAILVNAPSLSTRNMK